jgi:adapter protein MecA 1/2
MPWWDGYFYSTKTEVNNKNDSSSVSTKNTNTQIDPLKLTKIAVQNKRDEKQDYNNTKEDEIDSADQEFDFLSKDLEDLDDKEIANVDETKVEKSEIEKNNKKSNKAFKNRKFVTGIFVFDSLDNLEEMCNRINKTWGVINSLYKNDGKYYLIVEKGKCNSEKYAHLLNVIIEHGKIYGAGKERVAFIEEHFTPFIKDNAINRIKRYL